MRKIYKYIAASGIPVSLIFVYTLINSTPVSKTDNVEASRSIQDRKVPTSLQGGEPDSISLGAPEKIQLTYENLKTANLSFDVARILLARCEKEIPDLYKRSMVCQTIIESLCRQGLVSEAWSLITPNPGSIRVGQIHSFFLHSGSTNLTDFTKYLSELEAPRDRRIALDSFLQVRPEAILDIDASRLFGGTAEERLGIVGGLSTALQLNRNPEIESSLIDRLMQHAASGKLDPGSFMNIVKNSSATDSFSRWEMLRNYNESFDPKSLETLQSGMAKNMIARDPEKAMSIITSDPTTKYSYPILSSAIQEYYKVSQDGANTWLTRNLENIDPATSQRIISVIAQEANRSLEFDTSRKWANRILNAEVRQQLLDQVVEREAEMSKLPSN